MSDNVNNPAHYGGADNPYEVIKVLGNWLTPTELAGFLKGNVIKYQARANRKHGAEDYAKAAWYANRLATHAKDNILLDQVELEDAIKKLIASKRIACAEALELRARLPVQDGKLREDIDRIIGLLS